MASDPRYNKLASTLGEISARLSKVEQTIWELAKAELRKRLGI